MFALIDLGAIVVPLTDLTKADHDYFFEIALVDFVNAKIKKTSPEN